LTTRPANSEKTFGYHRAGILAALANSTTLIVIALAIFYEAYRRALNPPTVEANILIAVALLAFAVNAGTAWLVWRDSDHDLNMRSAFVHLAGDAVSTLGALVAGIGIALTGWQTLDPLISVLMGVLILIGAWRILRETVEILLEGTPHGLDLEEMVRDLMRMDGVRGVHDLHAWSINSHLRALSAHVLTDDVSLSDGARLQHEMNQLLRGKYAIEHTTLQLECVGCVPDELFCDMDGEGSGDQS
jgi:cobalt-zinc-cadmium efflux system protein